MNILVTRSNISNKNEYSKNNVETIKNVGAGLTIDLVNPLKTQVNKFISQAEIIICSRHNYNDYLDFTQAKNLKWVHITSAGVGKIAKSFGMHINVLKHKRTISGTNVDSIYSRDKFNNMLRNSDFIINCLPLTSETRGLFDFSRFTKMKKTAYFINVGVGSTVVETDLIRALDEKVIAGAGLDVFEEEPLPKTSRLWETDNVIITPHNAGKTPHYIDRMIEIFCFNLRAFLEGKPLPNLVDKKAGY